MILFQANAGSTDHKRFMFTLGNNTPENLYLVKSIFRCIIEDAVATMRMCRMGHGSLASQHPHTRAGYCLACRRTRLLYSGGSWKFFVGKIVNLVRKE
jgi:hypothetical protein